MEYQKAMLADLMSQYVEVDNKDFWDESVCKNYLVNFCPHLLFTNTKSDLGACNKIHNDRLREKYQQTDDKSKYTYEEDFYEFLQQLINDVQRKIRNGRDRVNLQDERKKESKEAVNEERHEKIVLLEVKIKELLQKIEEAGEEGRVQEASDLTNQVEKLQTELKLLQETDEMASKTDKRMEVCEICGALLVTHDAGEKPTAHFDGKQHLGYLKIRETLDEHSKARAASRDRDYSRAKYDYRRESRDHHRGSRHERSRRDDYHRSSSGRNRDRYDDEWNREMERYSHDRRKSRRSRSRSPRRW